MSQLKDWNCTLLTGMAEMSTFYTFTSSAAPPLGSKPLSREWYFITKAEKEQTGFRQLLGGRKLLPYATQLLGESPQLHTYLHLKSGHPPYLIRQLTLSKVNIFTTSLKVLCTSTRKQHLWTKTCQSH